MNNLQIYQGNTVLGSKNLPDEVTISTGSSLEDLCLTHEPNRILGINLVRSHGLGQGIDPDPNRRQMSHSVSLTRD